MTWFGIQYTLPVYIDTPMLCLHFPHLISSSSLRLLIGSQTPLASNTIVKMKGLCNLLQGLKPVMLMVFVQIACAAVNIIYKVAINDGMSMRVATAYRLAFASAFTIPVALIFDRSMSSPSSFICFNLFSPYAIFFFLINSRGYCPSYACINLVWEIFFFPFIYKPLCENVKFVYITYIACVFELHIIFGLKRFFLTNF